MTAHRYWRLYILENNGDPSYVSVSELEMFTTVGGANQCTGGTPLYSTQEATWTAAKAFDGIKNADQGWANSTGNHLGSYIGYDFGSGVTKDIVQFAITCRQTTLDQAPKTFQLQWSDDGADWNSHASQPTQTSWTSNQTRTFLTAPAIVDLPCAYNSYDITLGQQKPVDRMLSLLGGTGSFSGRAMKDSSAVVGARVRAFDETTGMLAAETITDAIGEFTLTGIKERRQYLLVCEHPNNTWEAMVMARRAPKADIVMRGKGATGAISVVTLT